MPYEPPYRPTSAIESLGIEIGELVGHIQPSAPLSTSVRLHRELRISSIRSSLVIEGNRLSEKQVTALIDGKRVLGPEEDILAVQNARRAYDAIATFDPRSEDDLLRAHGMMMKGLVADAGHLRSGNVGVFDGDEVIHMGALASVVPEMLANLFEWLCTTFVHPLVASCLFHCELELIHPFSDGNGRVGRFWQTVILASWRNELQWLPVETVILQRQQAYYEALATTEHTGSDEPFVEFMLTAIRDALLPFAVDDAPGEETLDESAPKHQASTRRADRSETALGYFADHDEGTISELAAVLGVSKRTAERLVYGLRNEGKLRREGSARGGRWIVTSQTRGEAGHMPS